MAVSTISFSKPSSDSAAGFGSDACGGVASSARLEERRRRREFLEQYFSPVVSEAAMPSAIDRLVMWRSHHGRHCI